MKLPILCSQCMVEDVANASPIAVVEFRDDGRYEVVCPKGHTSTTILQQQKFEVLFDIGAFAIVDGYYREAVSSFTSGLERFYEWFIQACLYEKGLDEKSISNAWKMVASQSERQFGAFAFLYAYDFGAAPPTLSNSRVAFRNEVIHKGKIPSRDEAVTYGQAVLDVIRPILRDTKKRFPNGVQKTILRHMTQCRSASDEGRTVSTICIPTIISLSAGEQSHDEKSLKEALKGLRKWG